MCNLHWLARVTDERKRFPTSYNRTAGGGADLPVLPGKRMGLTEEPDTSAVRGSLGRQI